MSEDNMTGWMKVLRPNAAEEEPQAEKKADDRLALTTCSACGQHPRRNVNMEARPDDASNQQGC